LKKVELTFKNLIKAAFALIIGFSFAACGYEAGDGLTNSGNSGDGSGRHWLITKQTTYAAAEGLAGSVETNYDWISYSYTNEKKYEKEYETKTTTGAAAYYHYTRNGQNLSLTTETDAETGSTTATYDSASGLILNSLTVNNKDTRTEISYAVSLLDDADGVKTYKHYIRNYVNNNIKQDITTQEYSEYKIQNGRTLEQKTFTASGTLISITSYALSDNTVIRDKLGSYTLYNSSSSAYNSYNTVEVISGSDSDSELFLREKIYKNNVLSSQVDSLYKKINFDSNNSGFIYTELDSITITGYKGKGGDVTIPERINGKPVTKIGREAFGRYNYNRGISSITIPNSVIDIEKKAFSGCPLINITIGNAVKSIGASAFSGCNGLTGITLPNGVTSIGEKAFEGCVNITEMIIPDSVTSIGDGAFFNSGLRTVTIGNGITGIGRAFSGCTSLTAVIIANGVTAIWDFAFSGCTGLTSVTIPSSVTNIGTAAFYDCAGLTNITIPNSVKGIGNAAFDRCISLTSVTFQGAITPDRFNASSFSGDLRGKYLAGGAGTYTREDGSSGIWTKNQED
jgi:hypothetical protein